MAFFETLSTHKGRLRISLNQLRFSAKIMLHCSAWRPSVSGFFPAAPELFGYDIELFITIFNLLLFYLKKTDSFARQR
jgi:hypothetical protein